MRFDAVPLLATGMLLGVGLTHESIRSRVRSGALVRVRRGWYCPGPIWSGLDGRLRHLVLARAVSQDVADCVLGGRSAAALWDLPVLGAGPDAVTLLTAYRGGGRSEPGVRRTTTGSVGAPIEIVGGLRTISLPRTVVDIAAAEGFVAGVVAADAALRRGVSRSDLWMALEQRSSRHGARMVAAVIAFVDARAESPGESAARASMYMLGFQVPELQVCKRDEEGEMWLDFEWPSVGAGGEFDGDIKYVRPDLHQGSPERVVLREKRREDRLRRQLRTVVRIVWADLRDPVRLTRILDEAGIPRQGSPGADGPAGPSNRDVIQLAGQGAGRPGRLGT
ncbi:MAG TPA: hypothetical protein VN200_01765 [Rhodoglobus sp.]|nr:hypothetical protein [Rhodoglobus sp.]